MITEQEGLQIHLKPQSQVWLETVLLDMHVKFNLCSTLCPESQFGVTAVRKKMLRGWTFAWLFSSIYKL